jgi:hypothetical protein
MQCHIFCQQLLEHLPATKRASKMAATTPLLHRAIKLFFFNCFFFSRSRRATCAWKVKRICCMQCHIFCQQLLQNGRSRASLAQSKMAGSASLLPNPKWQEPRLSCHNPWAKPLRNRLDQKLVEKLVRAHTNLVLGQYLPRNTAFTYGGIVGAIC